MDIKSTRYRTVTTVRIIAFMLFIATVMSLCVLFGLFIYNNGQLFEHHPMHVLPEEDYYQSEALVSDVGYMMNDLYFGVLNVESFDLADTYLSMHSDYYVRFTGKEEITLSNAVGQIPRWPSTGSYISYRDGHLTVSISGSSDASTVTDSGSDTPSTATVDGTGRTLNLAEENLYSGIASHRILSPGYEWYIDLDEQYLSDRAEIFNIARTQLWGYIIAASVLLLVLIILFILLIVIAGKKSGVDGVYLGGLARLPSDVLLCALGFVTFFALFWAVPSVSHLAYYNYAYEYVAVILFYGVVLAPILLGIFLALVRQLKGRVFIKHSLIYYILAAIFNFFATIADMIRALGDGRPFRGDIPIGKMLFVRQRRYVISSAAIVAIAIFFSLARVVPIVLGLIALEIFITYVYLKANNRTYQDVNTLCNQIYLISQGEDIIVGSIPEQSPFWPISRTLSELGDNVQDIVDRQLRSERTKIALVTNVSHDIKTPLTGIIGYIDLLGRVEHLPPEAGDYVTVLGQKAQRLKSIVDDLFDLAKTTSGDVKLDIEALDLRTLILQILADMEDSIQRHDRTIKLSIPEQVVPVCADGKRLFRVMQNVIDNALKYSMPGTRIFLSLDCDGGNARITLKNTAAYEMDFTAHDMLERFTRGDSSRTDEGSGLGLSIANSFTQACGGSFDVQIDGDQFKVYIDFPISTERGVRAYAPPISESEPISEHGIEELDSLSGSEIDSLSDQSPTDEPPGKEAQFEEQEAGIGEKPDETDDIL